MIFRVQLGEKKDNNDFKIYLTSDNIDIVNIIIRNLLMMKE